MVKSPNYPDTDMNHDRKKYNCQLLGIFTIVTTKVIEEGKEFMIDNYYSTENGSKTQYRSH